MTRIPKTRYVALVVANPADWMPMFLALDASPARELEPIRQTLAALIEQYHEATAPNVPAPVGRPRSEACRRGHRWEPSTTKVRLRTDGYLERECLICRKLEWD